MSSCGPWGQVFTREVLLSEVWGYRHAADTRLVNVHVQRLRAKIERDPERPEIVLQHMLIADPDPTPPPEGVSLVPPAPKG